MSAPIPRFLPLRRRLPAPVPSVSALYLLSRPRWTLPSYRNASTASSKPIMLEKPERFNPPSHPARLDRRPPRNYPGPPVSERERQVQKSKQYPNSMPPEGTWRYWFLTTKIVHVYIVLAFLACLAFTAWKQSFYHTCKFTHLLPPGDYFFSHPIDFISQWVSIYKLHVEQRSQEVAEIRRKKLDDLQKRNAYRKAHGITDPQGFWGFGKRLEYYDVPKDGEVKDVGREPGEAAQAKDSNPVAPETAVQDGEYQDFAGKRRKPVKKWLGIWT